MKSLIGIFVLCVAVIGAVIVFAPNRPEHITNESAAQSLPPNQDRREARYEIVSTDGIEGLSSVFSFSFALPEGWRVEASDKGSTFYVFADDSESAPDDSDIFVEFFEANSFQKPESFTILSRTDASVNGRPAVTYIVSKPDELSPEEPSWLAGTHRSVDIRAVDENPSVFFVFSKNPSLPDTEFQRLLNSVTIEE